MITFHVSKILIDLHQGKVLNSFMIELKINFHYNFEFLIVSHPPLMSPQTCHPHSMESRIKIS